MKPRLRFTCMLVLGGLLGRVHSLGDIDGHLARSVLMKSESE